MFLVVYILLFYYFFCVAFNELLLGCAHHLYHLSIHRANASGDVLNIDTDVNFLAVANFYKTRRLKHYVQ